MAEIIKTPNTPYFDDFDSAKKFLRVLFRPGYSVQTRELNQMQSILNDQIGSMADYFFQEGQKVIGGEISIKQNSPYIKLLSPLSRTDSSLYVNAKIKNASETITATIVKVVRAVGGDPDTLYLEYDTTSASDNTTQTFSSDENVIVALNDSSLESKNVASGSSAVGVGSLASVLNGIYYISGQFVRVDSQIAVLSKYTSVASEQTTSIGFEVAEKIVTPEEDQSLLDNALGAPNETAPGAHRLVITAELKRIEDVADIANFMTIVTLRNGEVVTQSRDTEFTVFEDILARRTFEESGDYIVDDFLVEVREQYDNGSNRGLSTLGDPNKIGIILDSGKAYVRGYEVQTTSSTILEAPKARTVDSKTELLVDGTYTSAFIIQSPVGVPAPFTQISLKEGASVIGTAFVKSVSFEGTRR